MYILERCCDTCILAVYITSGIYILYFTEDYVVIGCGPVGLMAIAAAQEIGAKRVFAIDMVEERLLLAKEFGAQPLTLNANDNGDSVVKTIMQCTENRGCAAVLDCVGSGTFFVDFRFVQLL